MGIAHAQSGLCLLINMHTCIYDHNEFLNMLYCSMPQLVELSASVKRHTLLQKSWNHSILEMKGICEEFGAKG